MATINNAKGLIITGGLGGPACCSLITAQFSLVCKCAFQVQIVGGGGYYPYHVITPYYTPQRAPAQDTCLVLVDIKLGDNHWRKSYVVDRGKGDTLIKMMTAFHRYKGKFVGAVTSFNRALKRTYVYFTSNDK